MANDVIKPSGAGAPELEEQRSPEAQAGENAEPSHGEEQELIFALDIGTRSVIGIVGVPEKGLLRVLAVEEEQHVRRAVIDGQIEDIAQTALVARSVKEKLEQRVGRSLRDVSIAAAGRALKTQAAEFELELDEKEAILDKQILELETGAIQQAYSQMAADETTGEPLDFLCVGHSVVNFWLDGYVMSTLLDHRGKRARVQIIATFLPSEVVESLYAVTFKVGLTVTSVTLEPIAAMNAVIPRELRMLNLALVDIGGGTSDIAISDRGSVVAYTMATVAGDEITECIMQELLVDFDTAEQIKLDLGKRPNQIQYRDILGFHYEVSGTEMEQKIHAATEALANEIADRILEANGKAPAAVFLVGGGSQLPMLCGMLAGRLAIDEKKVAVGGSNYMKRMVTTEEDISAPEFATPVGIAITAMSSRLEKGLAVSINGKKVTLLKNGTSTVLELLLLSGFQYSQIMGRSGASVIYELDGERKSVRGEHSIPAEVQVNGKPASVSTPVRPDDQITFRAAHSGADAAPTIRSELGDFITVRFGLSDREWEFQTEVLLNGNPAQPDQRIQNGDRVNSVGDPSMEAICRKLELRSELFHFLVNGEEHGFGYPLEDGDFIEAVPNEAKSPSRREEDSRPAALEESATVQSADAFKSPDRVAPQQQEPSLQQPALGETIQEDSEDTTPRGLIPPEAPPSGARESFRSAVNWQEPLRSGQLPWAASRGTGERKLEPFQAEPSEPPISHSQGNSPVGVQGGLAEGASLQVIRVDLNGNWVELYPKEDGTPYQFVDMLNFVDIDPSKPQGNIVLRLNGRNASYLDVVRDGDQIAIQWDRRTNG